MKISYRGDYALKTLIELALQYNRGVVSIHDLAKKGDIPVKFLEQVLLALKKGGFVESKRGVSGGYSLAKSPDKIILGDVIRFLEGPIEPVVCSTKERYDECKDFNSCVLKEIWNNVYTATSLVVDTVSFAELARRSRLKKEHGIKYTYSI